MFTDAFWARVASTRKQSMFRMTDATPPRPAHFIANLRRVLATSSARRRLQLAVTLLLTAAGSVAELVTIGAVLPVLAIAAAPDSVASVPVLGSLLAAMASASGVSAIVAAAIVLIAAAVAATAIRLMLTWVSQKFVYGLQQDLVMEMYGRALRQPYSWYVRQNSSVLVSGLEKIYVVTVGIIAPLVLALTSAAMALCVTIFLFMIDPSTALVASLSIGLIYLALSVLGRGTVRTASRGLAETRTARIRTMQETLGGIRDIILDQSHPMFEAKLIRIEEKQRRLLIIANFLQLAPRLVVEGAAIILVACMAAWFSMQPGGVLAAIPVLGALALGAQRLLPMIQSIYVGWAGCSIYSDTLQDVVDLLNTPIETAEERNFGEAVLPFRNEIELRQVAFSYIGGRDALSDIDLKIAKGERIGLIGKTGSGKSTLVDIIMGLLPPTKGALMVDGEAIGDTSLANWKAQIAHVPQTIFLADDSVAANIAFGCSYEEIDTAKVAEAARKAGLLEFIDALPERLATSVGERGIRLSGGQRQRIGIARALYKNASVLVLDEATSALDDETEAAVMESVARLGPELTVILIAHRLSTVATCDRVYRLSAGRIVQVGSFDQVAVGNKPGAASLDA
jgi:ATP-binding cassette, subfamily B, bacterial PglK